MINIVDTELIIYLIELFKKLIGGLFIYSFIS